MLFSIMHINGKVLEHSGKFPCSCSVFFYLMISATYSLNSKEKEEEKHSYKDNHMNLEKAEETEIKLPTFTG